MLVLFLGCLAAVAESLGEERCVGRHCLRDDEASLLQHWKKSPLEPSTCLVSLPEVSGTASASDGSAAIQKLQASAAAPLEAFKEEVRKAAKGTDTSKDAAEVARDAVAAFSRSDMVLDLSAIPNLWEVLLEDGSPIDPYRSPLTVSFPLMREIEWRVLDTQVPENGDVRVGVTIPCGSLPPFGTAQYVSLRDDGVRTSSVKSVSSEAWWGDRAKGFEKYGASFVSTIPSFEVSKKKALVPMTDNRTMRVPVADISRPVEAGATKIAVRGPESKQEFWQRFRLTFPRILSSTELPLETMDAYLEDITSSAEGLQLTFQAPGDGGLDLKETSIPMDQEHLQPHNKFHHHVDFGDKFGVRPLSGTDLINAVSASKRLPPGTVIDTLLTFVLDTVAVVAAVGAEVGIDAAVGAGVGDAVATGVAEAGVDTAVEGATDAAVDAGTDAASDATDAASDAGSNPDETPDDDTPDDPAPAPAPTTASNPSGLAELGKSIKEVLDVTFCALGIKNIISQAQAIGKVVSLYEQCVQNRTEYYHNESVEQQESNSKYANIVKKYQKPLETLVKNSTRPSQIMWTSKDSVEYCIIYPGKPNPSDYADGQGFPPNLGACKNATVPFFIFNGVLESESGAAQTDKSGFKTSVPGPIMWRHPAPDPFSTESPTDGPLCVTAIQSGSMVQMQKCTGSTQQDWFWDQHGLIKSSSLENHCLTISSTKTIVVEPCEPFTVISTDFKGIHFSQSLPQNNQIFNGKMTTLFLPNNITKLPANLSKPELHVPKFPGCWQLLPLISDIPNDLLGGYFTMQACAGALE